MFWAVGVVTFVAIKKIRYSRTKGRVKTEWVEHDKSPVLYWSIIGVMSAIAIWIGIAYVQGLTTHASFTVS
jgi:hypothetical protein